MSKVRISFGCCFLVYLNQGFHYHLRSWVQGSLPEHFSTFQLLSSFIFDDISFSEDETILASFRMFTQSGLLEKFSIDKTVRSRHLLEVAHSCTLCTSSETLYIIWSIYIIVQTLWSIYIPVLLIPTILKDSISITAWCILMSVASSNIMSSQLYM